MATVAITIRMEKNLKEEFERTCESLGLSMTAAINIFAAAVVKEQAIPFRIQNGTSREEMILDFLERMQLIARTNADGKLTLKEIELLISEAEDNRNGSA